MIKHTIKLRPRYGEVDQMGYVYHANYITYFHLARTELLRKLGVSDGVLEQNNIMLPVINISASYKKPAHYDELLSIQACLNDESSTRLIFDFQIKNEKNELICIGNTNVVCVNSETRKPIRIPRMVEKALHNYYNSMSL